MIYCSYRPQTDITAYELAVLLPVLTRATSALGRAFVTFTSSEWESIPAHVQRHFDRYDGDIEAEDGDHALLRHLGAHPGRA